MPPYDVLGVVHRWLVDLSLLFRRQSEIDAKARDARLQRALEEVERFKALLQEQRAADRDHKDVNKSEYNRVFAGGCCCACSDSALQ